MNISRRRLAIIGVGLVLAALLAASGVVGSRVVGASRPASPPTPQPNPFGWPCNAQGVGWALLGNYTLVPAPNPAAPPPGFHIFQQPLAWAEKYLSHLIFYARSDHRVQDVVCPNTPQHELMGLEVAINSTGTTIYAIGMDVSHTPMSP